MRVKYIDSPLGPLRIAVGGGALRELSFASVIEAPEGGEDPLLEETQSQLMEYFAGERRAFDLPLAPEGTDFRRRVWQALLEIPYGETRSYGEIAAAIGQPGAARAVGMANNRNPISIVIPCHRVVGADGALVGYGGGLEKKHLLLELEGK